VTGDREQKTTTEDSEEQGITKPNAESAKKRYGSKEYSSDWVFTEKKWYRVPSPFVLPSRKQQRMEDWNAGDREQKKR
jgi:hypothetical protein